MAEVIKRLKVITEEKMRNLGPRKNDLRSCLANNFKMSFKQKKEEQKSSARSRSKERKKGSKWNQRKEKKNSEQQVRRTSWRSSRTGPSGRPDTTAGHEDGVHQQKEGHSRTKTFRIKLEINRNTRGVQKQSRRTENQNSCILLHHFHFILFHIFTYFKFTIFTNFCSCCTFMPLLSFLTV